VKTIKWNQLARGGFWVLLVGATLSCGGQNGSKAPRNGTAGIETEESVDQPVIIFDTLIHDFGTIIEGESVVCYFDYWNGGEEELLITTVEAACGCTTPSWNRDPLGPGEKGHLEVIFDASGRSGLQRKVITVMSNATNQVVRLTICANVNNSV
jgi:hypothetical protein